MKLGKLQPRLQTLSTRRLVTLDAKAGSTERIRGTPWMAIRRRIQMRDHFACAGCGAVRADHEVDHIVPLEQGGSNDDANLQLLCNWVDAAGKRHGCHAAKTAREARERAGNAE